MSSFLSMFSSLSAEAERGAGGGVGERSEADKNTRFKPLGQEPTQNLKKTHTEGEVKRGKQVCVSLETSQSSCELSQFVISRTQEQTSVTVA